RLAVVAFVAGVSAARTSAEDERDRGGHGNETDGALQVLAHVHACLSVSEPSACVAGGVGCGDGVWSVPPLRRRKMRRITRGSETSPPGSRKSTATRMTPWLIAVIVGSMALVTCGTST